MSLQLVQWNISYNCKIDKIADFILSTVKGPTVVCLQEVLAMHKDRLIERLAPTDYAYSLDHRKPGLYDAKNRRMGVMTMLFGGVIEEASVLNRTVFPDRTLYTKTRIGEESVGLLNFHSITGVGYRHAKGANFASIAEFLHETVDLDFFCCDANEPQVDSFDACEMKFWNPNSKATSLLFGENKVHHLTDPVQTDPLFFDTLPFSHITGKNKRRYDFIYRSGRWTTKRFDYYYSESVEATSDHAMVVGVFDKM